jgi:hypothetical protein
MPEWNEASSELVNMARELINEYHPTLKEARIGFLFRDEAPRSKGRVTMGKAQKVPLHLKPLMDYDFIIWIAEDIWDSLPEERRRALVDHQLSHCYLDPIWGATIRPHDVEEFVDVVDRHGFWTYDLLRIQEKAKGGQLVMNFHELKHEGRVESVNPKQVAKGLL